VVGAALGTALLPLLARQLRGGQSLSAHRSINRGVELALLLALPAAIGLAVAAEPIIGALFQRGAFCNSLIKCSFIPRLDQYIKHIQMTITCQH
jgi:peptidoglycan biosynthesis protein MviN/MurJ (putative lipid II flippase)